MYEIIKGAAFKRQAAHFVADYKQEAGETTALNFISGLEHSMKFIAANPQACAVYTNFRGYEYRRWHVKNFPHSIFFRIGKNTVILEALYANRMNIAHRFPLEIEVDNIN